MNDKELAIFVGQKIKEYRLLKRLTQKELAIKIGMGDTTIVNYEKGIRTPKKNTIFKIAEVLDVSVDDFFPPRTKTNTQPTVDSQLQEHSAEVLQLDKALSKHPRQHKQWVSYGHELINQNTTLIEEPTTPYQVTVTTKLAAGLGYAFNDYDQETRLVPNKPPRHDLASLIQGDSMEPDYHDGDIVYLIDKGVSSYNGEVCAVAVENKTYLKRVYTQKGSLRLVSLNSKYDDIIIDFPPTDGHLRIYTVVGTDSVVEG